MSISFSNSSPFFVLPIFVYFLFFFFLPVYICCFFFLVLLFFLGGCLLTCVCERGGKCSINLFSPFFFVLKKIHFSKISFIYFVFFFTYVTSYHTTNAPPATAAFCRFYLELNTFSPQKKNFFLIYIIIHHHHEHWLAALSPSLTSLSFLSNLRLSSILTPTYYIYIRSFTLALLQFFFLV